jgi:mRNA interferase HigB
MIIISKSKLYQSAKNNSSMRNALDDWYRKVKIADWANMQDVKKTFNSVDYIGNDRFVFNIKGNNYRLVALIHFNRRTLYIRFIGTHSKYDDIDSYTI